MTYASSCGKRCARCSVSSASRSRPRCSCADASVSSAGAPEPSGAARVLTLASAQEQRGRLREALETLQRAHRLPHEDAYVIADEARLRHLLHRDTRDSRTLARINRLVAGRRLDAAEAALCYIAFGLRDQAVAVLR